MKLSTKTRYGTRLIIDLALNYENGHVQLSKIANRLDISLKYLELIISSLKKAGYISTLRGAKGGYKLKIHPKEITVGEVVAVLEGGTCFVECTENKEACEKSENCLTRLIWKDAAEAMYEKLYSITFFNVIQQFNP